MSSAPNVSTSVARQRCEPHPLGLYSRATGPSHRRRFPLGYAAGCLVVMVLLLPWPSHGKESPVPMPAKESPAQAFPLQIRSTETDSAVEGDITGSVEFSYAQVRALLEQAAAWCSIISLHFNVKACVHGAAESGQTILSVYNGRKRRQALEDAVTVDYLFDSVRNTDNSFSASLSTVEGAPSVGEQHFTIEASAENEHSTKVRLKYVFRGSAIAERTLKIYLATAGRHKIGFSVVKRERDGAPQYVQGLRGMIERNAVRYYFAIVATLEALEIDPVSVEQWRAERWFDLTETYHAQLHEVDRNDYLATKRGELEAQRALQNRQEHAEMRAQED